MATATINLPKETVEGLGRVAEQRGVAVADLAQEAIRQYLHREAERKIAKEEAAYRAQHSRLLEQYEGRFIAMHEGQVVDHDEDELRLYLRIRRRYPLLGVLIKRVSPEVDKKWTVRSPRLEYK